MTLHYYCQHITQLMCCSTLTRLSSRLQPHLVGPLPGCNGNACPCRKTPMASRPARAWRCWGLRYIRQLLDLHIRVPVLKHVTQFMVQCFHPSLEQQMCPAFAPLHLLFLAESFTHHLVHRGLHEP